MTKAAKAVRIRARFKKGDQVHVMSGKDKGRVGEVLRVDLDRQVVYIKNVNLQHRHTKPRRQGEKGGIIDMEGPVHLSNVLVQCPTCLRGVRRLCQDTKTCPYNQKG